jgi:hypothetical protein
MEKDLGDTVEQTLGWKDTANELLVFVGNVCTEARE